MSAPKRPRGRRERTKAAVGRTLRASLRSPGSVLGKGYVSNPYRSPPSRSCSDSCVVDCLGDFIGRVGSAVGLRSDVIVPIFC